MAHDAEHRTRLVRRTLKLSRVLLAAVTLTGCAGVFANAPVNVAMSPTGMATPPPQDIVGDTIVGLSFSGGGTRAAAFSYGVLRGLEDLPAPGDPTHTALDRVSFISAVSGGAITAAYFGLKGPQSYHDLDERFLYADIERSLNTNLFNPGNIRRLLRGGLNDRATFGVWLDSHLFAGATFADVYKRRRPEIWINASDLYHHSPFPFTPAIFQTFCSDVSQLPLSEAVSASAAVPLAFSPVVVKRFPDRCSGVPAWAAKALADPLSPRTVRGAASAARDYADANAGRFIKLADGGLTDNFGLTSIVINRYAAETPYGPMTAHDAIVMRRMLFLVVSSEQPEMGNWTTGATGPGIVGVIKSSTDTAIATAIRLGYDSFVQTMAQWRTDLIAYRCGLSQAEVQRLAPTSANWRCDDVDIRVIEVNFESLPSGEWKDLYSVPTAFTLERRDVDRLIDAGRRAVVHSGAAAALIATAAPAPQPAKPPLAAVDVMPR